MVSSQTSLPEKFITRMQNILPPEKQDAFFKSFEITQRIFIVINPLTQPADVTLNILKDLKLDLRSHPEVPLLGQFTWSISSEFRELLTHHESHTFGHFYIMGLPSILSIATLAPKPHERILDLTAAPGGKTFLMAMLMENTGEIIAIDQSRSRFFKLKANLERLNVTNTTCLLRDGRRLPKSYFKTFDRVLLDAPCSCESRFNLHQPKTLKYWGIQKIKACVSTQKQLILNAFRACKPNAKLIYSTCTYAPEENEGIIAYLQKKHPTAKPQPIHLPYGSLGLTQWDKAKYPEGYTTLRIFPNDLHTGGCLTQILCEDPLNFIEGSFT